MSSKHTNLCQTEWARGAQPLCRWTPQVAAAMFRELFVYCTCIIRLVPLIPLFSFLFFVWSVVWSATGQRLLTYSPLSKVYLFPSCPHWYHIIFCQQQTFVNCFITISQLTSIIHKWLSTLWSELIQHIVLVFALSINKGRSQGKSINLLIPIEGPPESAWGSFVNCQVYTFQ